MHCRINTSFSSSPWEYLIIYLQIWYLQLRVIAVCTCSPMYRALAQSSQAAACSICVVGQISSEDAADQKELTAHKSHLWVGWKFTGATSGPGTSCLSCSLKPKAPADQEFNLAGNLFEKKLSSLTVLSSQSVVIPASNHSQASLEKCKIPGKFHKYSLGPFCYLLDFCWFKLFGGHFAVCPWGDYISYKVDYLPPDGKPHKSLKRSLIHTSAVISTLATGVLPIMDVTEIFCDWTTEV